MVAEDSRTANRGDDEEVSKRQPVRYFGVNLHEILVSEYLSCFNPFHPVEPIPPPIARKI
jgi:hypothetical protein